MKILILGSGSFAGQALFSYLLLNGFEVFGINRSGPKNHKYWPWIKIIGNEFKENWYEININTNPEEIVKIINFIKPTHIVDFMGQGMVAQSWGDPSLWYSTNISSKVYVLEQIKNLTCLEKYVRASTPEVYGSSTKFIKESSSFNPSTPYAVSHCAIDYHIRCIGSNYDFPYSIGRFANFYGVGQQLYRVIPKAILSFTNGEKFTIDGDGKSLRRFIFSDDIISAIENLLFKSNPKTEYNFSGSEELSILDLIKIITNYCSVDFNEVVQFGPEREGKDLIYRLNCDKAKKDFEWESKVSMKKGISKVQNWIYENNDFLSKSSWNYIHKC